MNTNSTAFKWKQRLGFGSIEFGRDLVQYLADLYLSIYLTTVALLPLPAISVMFLVCKVIDAITDVIVGALVDKTNTKWGRSRPWIYAGAIVYIIGITTLFKSPDFSATGKIVYTYIAYIIYTLGMTMVNIPEGTLMASLTTDAKERTVIGAVRNISSTIFDEFANNLSPETVSGRGTGETREKNIKRLLNFFPVLGEDDEGRMVELDAKAVLSIPRKLKSQEVVRHGFMSNFLFQNIGVVFGAPGIVKEIVGKLTPAQEDPKRNKRDGVERIGDIPVDEDGNVDIPNEIVIGRTQDLFGEKIYETMHTDVQAAVDAIGDGSTDEVARQLQNVVESVKETVKAHVVEPAAGAYNVKKSTQNRVERQVEREIETAFEKLHDDYVQQTNIAKVELQRAQKEAESAAEIRQAEAAYQESVQNALNTFTETVKNEVQRTIEEKPQELVEQLEKHKVEEEKRGIEDDVRAHLRGFSRTIPSFIMAYGDDGLTLANFDEYTENDVFLEVTGITHNNFRFLRDGGDYTDPESGEIKHFDGHLFDEVVFNDSIREFLRKKQELADYFDESHEEDIFDYIPPQKTNQIFTPKWVVRKMVDELEANNPGCFDDPDKTFADLYMKSGLYITEIVKRLYRSEKMKSLSPDDKARIRHILDKQVYGMAPTRIIYLIATNYILGFDETLKDAAAHFVQSDAAEASKNGTLNTLVSKRFHTC